MLALPAVSSFASAQAYPTQPVRLVVGFAAGQAIDILARLIAQSLAEQLGQQFIVPDPLHRGWLAVLAGMGKPGGFGIPELTVAVRELAWTLGRTHCRHVASVLIGAGAAAGLIIFALRA